MKSLEELHGLWFVLLRERNVLNTEREAARSQVRPMAGPHRLQKVAKSMSRIRRVLGERSQAVADAKAILEKRVADKRALQARIDAAREAHLANTTI